MQMRELNQLLRQVYEYKNVSHQAPCISGFELKWF